MAAQITGLGSADPVIVSASGRPRLGPSSARVVIAWRAEPVSPRRVTAPRRHRSRGNMTCGSPATMPLAAGKNSRSRLPETCAARSTPSGPIPGPGRQHRLKGSLGTGAWKGETLERWQYEVTSGGRIRYLVDDIQCTAWITYAGTGHPKITD